MPTIRAFAGFIAIAVVCTTPAMAQGHREPTLAVTFGVGQVDPIPLGLAYRAPTWSTALQVAVAKHLVVEGVVSGWRHTASDPFDFEISDRALTISRRGVAEQRDRKASVGLNVLAAGTIKRVRLTSGVGVGRAFFRSVLSQVVTSCVSSRPSDCAPRPSDTWQTWLFSVQAVLGVDVSLTARIRASLTYRLSQPFATDLGDASVLTGLAVGFR